MSLFISFSSYVSGFFFVFFFGINIFLCTFASPINPVSAMTEISFGSISKILSLSANRLSCLLPDFCLVTTSILLFASLTTTDFLVCAFFFPEYAFCCAFFFFGLCFNLSTASTNTSFASGNNRKNSSGSEIFLCGNTNFLCIACSIMGNKSCIQVQALERANPTQNDATSNVGYVFMYQRT